MINKNILQSIENFKFNTDGNQSTQLKSLQEKLDTINRLIDGNSQTIVNLQHQNIEYSKAAAINEKSINEIKQREKDDKNRIKINKELNNIYSKLKKLPIEKIVSDNNVKPTFFILTKPLVCGNIGREEDLEIQEFQDMVGKEIGEFIIKISPTQIKVCNITNRCNAEYDLPTVHYGSCCWGSLSNLITRKLSEKDFYALVDLIIDFISSPSFGGPYCHWDFWLKGLRKPIFGEVIYSLALSSSEQVLVNDLLGEKKNTLMGDDIVAYTNDDDEPVIVSSSEFTDDNGYDAILFTNTGYHHLS